MYFISVIILLVTFLLFIFTLRGKSRKLKLPPGPTGIPIFGNAFEINERNMFDKLMQYADKYGDIVKIRLLNNNIICLNSSEIIRKALCTDPFRDHINDRGENFLSEFIFYGSQNIAFYIKANSKVHRGMRKGYTRALHVYDQEGISSFEKMILSELDYLNNRIEKFEGKEFDVLEVIRRSLTNVISVLLIGELVPDDDEDINMFWNFINELLFLINPTVNILLVTFPWLRFAPGFRSHISGICKAKEKLLKRFFKNRERNTTDKSKCLVESLFEEQMKAIEEGREVIFTNERIKATILETVLAGINTTWSVLTSSILCLINYPEYQDKIFEELEKNIGKDQKLNRADKEKCPFLEAVELEVHRLFTVVPTYVGRMCTEDINLEGYDIPKGTGILVNIWNVHHDKNIWGDPWNFRPERFLNTEGHLIGRDSILRQNWMPFSMGRRQCIGEQFARSRYFLYMASLLRKWKFVGVPGKFSPLDAKGLRNFDTKVTIKPKPFFCTAKKRVMN